MSGNAAGCRKINGFDYFRLPSCGAVKDGERIFGMKLTIVLMVLMIKVKNFRNLDLDWKRKLKGRRMALVAFPAMNIGNVIKKSVISGLFKFLKFMQKMRAEC